MNWLKNKKIVAVHDGNFHPDDVFSVAVLSILYDGKIKVVRTRDEKVYSRADFVVDYGFEYNPSKGWFDHHQEGGAGMRNDKITYSAFGLVWKEYGEKICSSKKVADIFDKKLVAAIDADDCGVDLCGKTDSEIKPFMLTDAIYAMRPTWKEDFSEIDSIFLKAVEFAKAVLLREIKITKDIMEAEGLVADIYHNTSDKKIIVFAEKYLPKTLLYKYPEPLFIVYKDKDGKRWRATTIEKDEDTYEPRKNFPEAWWGKKDEEFIKISGVADAFFCRNKGIFAGAESMAGAIKLAEAAINHKK